MRLFKRSNLVPSTIVAIFMLTAPASTKDDAELIALYDQYNVQLRQLNISEPILLLDKGKISKAKRVLKKINTSSLRKFYTAALSQSNEACQSSSNCRLSDFIFLDMITMKKYDVIALDQVDDETAKLVIAGENYSGLSIQLILKWIFEGGEWKIDATIKAPENWIKPK